jgi:hypothetical protein
MNIRFRLILATLAVCVGVRAFAALPLTESTFTEIIKQANVVAAADKSVSPAKVNEVFRVPDLVRTGPESRLEMTAPDKTITRVGENSVFTFEPGGRNILIDKGSVLFHPPAGVGGGLVQHDGTTAAVLGTTMVCSVMPDGSFKIMLLEGNAMVMLENGKSIEVDAGQMVVVPPDGESFGPVTDVNLAEVVPHLQLVNGFSNPLSSMPLIQTAIQTQQQQLKADHPFNFAPLDSVLGGLDIDVNTFADLSVLLHNNDQTTISISPTTGAHN